MCFGSPKSDSERKPTQSENPKNYIKPLLEYIPVEKEKTLKTDKISFENRHKNRGNESNETSSLMPSKLSDEISDEINSKPNSKSRSSVESLSSSSGVKSPKSKGDKKSSKKQNSKSNQFPDPITHKDIESSIDKEVLTMEPLKVDVPPQTKDFTGGPDALDSSDFPIKITLPTKEKRVGALSKHDSTSSSKSSQSSSKLSLKSSTKSSESSVRRKRRKKSKKKTKPLKVLQPIYFIIFPSKGKNSQTTCQNLLQMYSKNPVIPTIPPAIDRLNGKNKTRNPFIIYGDSCTNNSTTSSVHYCQCSEVSNSVYSMSDII